MFWEQLEADQARRVALAMQGAAEALSRRHRTNATESDLSFADSLDDSALRLTELAGTGDAF
jgi:hypothetical protein